MPLCSAADGPLTALQNAFPRLDLRAIEIQTEEYAGAGFGVLLIVVTTLLGGLLQRRKGPHGRSKASWPALLIAGSGLFAAAVFLAKFGNEAGPRLFLPYYPVFLFAIYLLPGCSSIGSARWMRVFAGISALSILPSLLLTPARPLIPVAWIEATVRALYLPERLRERVADVYQAYAVRNDAMGPVREHLPSTEKTIGWIAGGNDPEVSLWWPFGSRTLVPVITTPKGDIVSPSDLPDICVVSQYLLDWFGYKNPESWAGNHGLEIVSRHEVFLTVNRGGETFYIMRRR